jgi:putative cardiolipin synthase
VDIRISTNSLASTDTAATFGGYHKQRKKLLKAGVQIYEFRPDPAVGRELLERYEKLAKEAPLFGLHAKTMVIDGETVFIGTFNLDARSANLNTEVGVLIRNPALASQVEASIERDMLPENSWDAAKDQPDAQAGFGRRVSLWFWKLLPIDPLL